MTVALEKIAKDHIKALTAAREVRGFLCADDVFRFWSDAVRLDALQRAKDFIAHPPEPDADGVVRVYASAFYSSAEIRDALASQIRDEFELAGWELIEARRQSNTSARASYFVPCGDPRRRDQVKAEARARVRLHRDRVAARIRSAKEERVRS